MPSKRKPGEYFKEPWTAAEMEHWLGEVRHQRLLDRYRRRKEEEATMPSGDIKRLRTALIEAQTLVTVYKAANTRLEEAIRNILDIRLDDIRNMERPMPSKTPKQAAAMRAAAAGKSTRGIPKKVGGEFVKADKAKAARKKG